MNFSELARKTYDKTRIAILSHDDVATVLLQYIAKKNGKSLYYIATNENNFCHDFIAVTTENPENIAEYKPNVVFIANNSVEKVSSEMLSSITGGGILIYPEKINLPETLNYFRKLPYQIQHPNIAGSNLTVNTSMGEIPVNPSLEKVIEDIEGLQLLCQQIGIMEEEFYEELIDLSID